MLRSDLKELFSEFESRMKFVNIVKSMLDNGSKIREMIPNKDILDNLVMMVLAYIKERTLGDNENCTLKDIAEFIEEISDIMPESYSVKGEELAKYIVVNILQNGGIPASYFTYNSKDGKFSQQYIRLLSEEKGNYRLTDEAFDFLFRSKEIESELDYSVTRFRMKEYLKRNNYSQALEQSRDLVARVRSMKLNIQDFLIHCRENFSKITIDGYESMILRVRALLKDEEKELVEISESAAERSEKLESAAVSGLSESELHRHKAALEEIVSNITLTIHEQRMLESMGYDLKEEYSRLLKEQYLLQKIDCMDFDADIMLPLRRSGEEMEAIISRLLVPLYSPKLKKYFNIWSIYDIRSIKEDNDNDEGITIESVEDKIAERTAARNSRYERITEAFFQYISTANDKFLVSAFIAELSDEQLFAFCYEDCLQNVLLTLYQIGEINIDTFKQSDDLITEPFGEFELAWCLSELPERLLCIHKLTFFRQQRSFSFTVCSETEQRKIEMTELLVEVER